MKFGYLCSSPLVICLGIGTRVSASAGVHAILVGIQGSLYAAATVITGRPPSASADASNDTAVDASVTAAPPRIPLRNSPRVAEPSPSPDSRPGERPVDFVDAFDAFIFILVIGLLSHGTFNSNAQN